MTIEGDSAVGNVCCHPQEVPGKRFSISYTATIQKCLRQKVWHEATSGGQDWTRALKILWRGAFHAVAPLHPWVWPTNPWQSSSTHVNFAGPFLDMRWAHPLLTPHAICLQWAHTISWVTHIWLCVFHHHHVFAERFVKTLLSNLEDIMTLHFFHNLQACVQLWIAHPVFLHRNICRIPLVLTKVQRNKCSVRRVSYLTTCQQVVETSEEEARLSRFLEWSWRGKVHWYLVRLASSLICKETTGDHWRHHVDNY